MRCRDCAYYQADPKNLGRGTCNEKPPVTATAFTQQGPLTATVRPSVQGDDRACAVGKPELADSSGTAANLFRPVESAK